MKKTTIAKGLILVGAAGVITSGEIYRRTPLASEVERPEEVNRVLDLSDRLRELSLDLVGSYTPRELAQIPAEELAERQNLWQTVTAEYDSLKAERDSLMKTPAFTEATEELVETNSRKTLSGAGLILSLILVGYGILDYRIQRFVELRGKK